MPDATRDRAGQLSSLFRALILGCGLLSAGTPAWAQLPGGEAYGPGMTDAQQSGRGIALPQSARSKPA